MHKSPYITLGNDKNDSCDPCDKPIRYELSFEELHWFVQWSKWSLVVLLLLYSTLAVLYLAYSYLIHDYRFETWNPVWWIIYRAPVVELEFTGTVILFFIMFYVLWYDRSVFKIDCKISIFHWRVSIRRGRWVHVLRYEGSSNDEQDALDLAFDAIYQSK